MKLLRNILTDNTKRHRNILLAIFLLGTLLFLVLLLLTHKRVGSDDTIFPTQVHPYPNVFSWLNYRYHSWSGRFIPDAFEYIFSQAPLYVWRIASLILYVIFSDTIFLYYRLFTKRRSFTKDYIMLGLAFALPLLMSAGAIGDGALWISGSMNYFWIAPFALIGLYPITYWLIKKNPANIFLTCAGLISTVIAASSQEQIGAALVGLSIAGFVYGLFDKELRDKVGYALYPLLSVIFGLSALIISITAPGDTLRLHAETLTWIPDFSTVPILARVNYSTRWLVDVLINHSTFLLGLSLVLLGALFIKKQNKDRLDYTFITILSMLALLLFTKGIETVSYWFTFYPVWASKDITPISYIPLVFWVVALLFIVVSPLVLLRKQKIGILITILYATWIADVALVTLSPTMYASGLRVLYIPSLILFFICYILFDKVFEKYKKVFFILAGITAFFFLSQYLLLLLKVIH